MNNDCARKSVSQQSAILNILKNLFFFPFIFPSYTGEKRSRRRRGLFGGLTDVLDGIVKKNKVFIRKHLTFLFQFVLFNSGILNTATGLFDYGRYE